MESRVSTTHQTFFRKNFWRKTDSRSIEECGPVLSPFIVPECSWTEVSWPYQLVIYFLMWFLFSGPCFSLLFLMHLVIGAFYCGPIIFSPTWRVHYGGHESDLRVIVQPGDQRKTSRIHPLQSEKLEICGLWRMTNFFPRIQKGANKQSVPTQTLDIF